MSRREFIAQLSALAAWPFTGHAQQVVGKVYRVGFLGGADPIAYAPQIAALHLGLGDHGYVEGKNIAIEYRWAEGKYDRLPAFAAELVQVLKVDVIITHGTPSALAAKQATTTIPIVMAIIGNPVESEVVASLARPGGNITGSSFFDAELNGKRLEVIKELIPGLTRAGALVNSNNPTTLSVLSVMAETARAINVELQPVKVRLLDELDAVFNLAKAQIEGLTISDDGLFLANAKRIAELALGSRLPSIGFTDYAEVGGLVGYGVDFPHIWRRSMVLVDKVLKGAKPADLPIQQATRFEFVINLKTARTLGLTMPPTVLARADRVIE